MTKRIAANVIWLVVSATFAMLLSPIAAFAVATENPSELATDLADDAVYVAPRRVGQVDPGSVLPVIARARAEGLTMYVLWPDDPQPNTGAFARRIQELYEVDVVLVFGPEGQLGSFVSDDYEDGAIRAQSAAREAEGPGAVADAYLAGLLEEPERERPAIVNELVRWIAIMVGLLVAAAVGEQMIRQYRRARQRRALEQLGVD